MKDTIFNKNNLLNIGGDLLKIDKPLIMGILNTTPDSFFDGGKYLYETTILSRAQQIIDEGGTIIDIGGYSSRPGAQHIDEKEELKRVIPAIKLIHYHFPETIISIDTFRANVAYQAVKYGAHIINDISAGEMDTNMISVVSELQVPYIIMHMQGTPQTMQHNPAYTDVVNDVIYYFSEKINLLTQKGINDVIIDPGFGFGKTLAHNYDLLNNLDAFKIFERPILAGISRKSMINKVLNISPNQALNGTSVLNTIAIKNGADILRVHDVRAAYEVVQLMTWIK